MLDDHKLVREGFRMLLSPEPDMEVVGEAADGLEGLALIRSLRPDVVLCDLQLPVLDGLEVTRQLVAVPEGPRVLIVSALKDGPLPRRVIASGAHGYVPKACPAPELLQAVRTLAEGRRYFSSEVARLLVTGITPFDELSEREFDVALALVGGDRIPEIAQRLNISASTVRTIKSRALRKIGVRSTGELLKLAAEYGLKWPGRWT